eukprot:scpid39142/ scgid29812/ 
MQRNSAYLSQLLFMGGLIDHPSSSPQASQKKYVHKLYVAACSEQNVQAVKKTAFNDIWKALYPHIKFMTARTDVCSSCELLRRAVSAAVTEQEKTTELQEFTAHMHKAQRERYQYQQASRDASAELKDVQPSYQPPYAPCSRQLSTHKVSLYVRLRSASYVASYGAATRSSLLQDAT